MKSIVMKPVQVQVLLVLALETQFLTLVIGNRVTVSAPSSPSSSNPQKLKSGTDKTTEIFRSGLGLDENEAPLCSVIFRRESSHETLSPEEPEPITFVIPFELGEPANPYQGSDDVIGKTFNGSRIPPFAKIQCISLYLIKFQFVGVEPIQFFRVTNKRYATESYGRYVHEITVETLLTPSATGEYVVHSVEQPMLRKSLTIVSERERAPFLLGYGKVLQADANETSIVIPCIAAKYGKRISLSWKADENYYLPIFNSGQSSLISVIRYDRRYGFILNVKNRSLRQQLLKGVWQANEFPFGEYKCETEDPTDNVIVMVKSVPDPPKDITSNKLMIDIKPGQKVQALCIGQNGSIVNLTSYDISRQEAHEFIRCLTETNGPCGDSFVMRQNGISFQHISALTGLPNTGFLACNSATGDFTHVFYYEGLSGKLYTEDPQKLPTSELLRVRIADFTNTVIPEEEFYPGSTVYVFCDTIGNPFLAEHFVRPKLVYAKYKDNPMLVLKGPAYAVDGAKVILEPNLEEVICNIQPLNSNMPLTLSRKVVLSGQNCTNSAKYFQCVNGNCISALAACNGIDDCGSGDNTDEGTDLCQDAFAERAPKIIASKSSEGNVIERKVVLNEVQTLACHVKSKGQTQYGDDVSGGLKVIWENRDGVVEVDHTSEISGYDETFEVYTIKFNVTRDDQYTCTASNRFGSDSVTYRFVVVEPCTNNDVCPPNPIEAPGDDPEAILQEFSCSAEGKHSDPYNCGIYHECVPNALNSSGYLHYQFACGIGTVYCAESQVCTYEHQCPCNNKVRGRKRQQQLVANREQQLHRS